VQQRSQWFGVEHEAGAFGAPGLGVHSRHPSPVKGMDGMAHALGGTTQLPGNVRGALPTRTGQQDLAPPQGKGLRGAQPGFELLVLLGSQASNRHRWFHATYDTIPYLLT
jgi:hypothetical protein